MSASLLLYPTTQVVTQSIAATGPGASFPLRMAEGYYAELYVSVSAGTVDVALEHSTDNGTTWRTLPLKFAQSAAAGSTSALAFKPSIGLSDAAFAVTPARTGAAQSVNIPFNVRLIRPYVTLGTAGATTFTLNFTMGPKGSVVQ